jgi:hypothetical protein
VTGALTGARPPLLTGEGGAPPSHRGRKAAASAVALALAAAGGYLLHRPGQPAPAPTVAAHSPAGAKLAAEGIAVDLGSVRFLDPGWRSRYLRETALPAALPYLSGRMDASVAQLARTAGITNLRTGATARGRLELVSAALSASTRVESYNGTSARVSVWTASVGGVTGPSSPWAVTSGWLTSTVSLQWDGTRWRLTGEDVETGPVPVPQSRPTGDVLARLGSAS